MVQEEVSEKEYIRNEIDLRLFVSKHFIKSKLAPIKPDRIKYNISQKNVLDLFKIDLTNHRKARLALHYHLRIQPSEIDDMFYMDFEFLLIDLNDLLKEKNEAEKKQYEGNKENTPNYSKQMNQMGKMKMPKMSMPKMPKF